MSRDFCKIWGSLKENNRKKCHLVKSHDSHSNQICGREQKSKKEKSSNAKNYIISLSLSI